MTKHTPNATELPSHVFTESSTDAWIDTSLHQPLSSVVYKGQLEPQRTTSIVMDKNAASTSILGRILEGRPKANMSIRLPGSALAGRLPSELSSGLATL